MLEADKLKDILHLKGLTRPQRMLLCLAASPLKSRTVAQVRNLAVGSGLTAVKKWNVSALLGELDGLAVRAPLGWELTTSGKAEVAKLTGTKVAAPATSTLRKHLGAIKSADVQSFVGEAIGSVESGHYRAAIVLAWVGALAVLYDHVVTSQLVAFNAEANRRDAKWKDAKTADDLTRLKEHEFLQILEAISVIGKSVKTELAGCLVLRNGAGHPNTLKVSEHRVNAHVETLALNVFSCF